LIFLTATVSRCCFRHHITGAPRKPQVDEIAAASFRSNMQIAKPTSLTGPEAKWPASGPFFMSLCGAAAAGGGVPILVMPGNAAKLAQTA
jgi:hypothetical protein